METVRAFLPTVLVFLAFVAVLTSYVVLEINGSDAGPLNELMYTLGGAVAGVATAGVATAAVRGGDK